MSDDTKCFACEPTAARLPKYAWRCTGRPGCVRAAGTEDIATRIACVRQRIADGEDIAGWIVLDGDAVAVDRVSWDEMCAEITRLRAEVERLTKEREEMLSHLVRANRNAVAFMDENERLTADRHARDVAMVKAGIEAAAKVADQWSRVSPLHNYGPAGPTRGEKTAMANAKMIAEDTRALDPAAIAASLNAKEE